ncbi:hypothetical protein DXT99_07330 [Pontibacter diazotrophicus]|uniref:Uncharacterized protein n=1 Tax=Pontibacter diazotrophicus TaxID=1400979 RepID=A0A3D8LEC3_9BACT|nr:hypothetical protein DXT99_07330 [Pontibacter diazotrophicus]
MSKKLISIAIWLYNGTYILSLRIKNQILIIHLLIATYYDVYTILNRKFGFPVLNQEKVCEKIKETKSILGFILYFFHASITRLVKDK